MKRRLTRRLTAGAIVLAAAALGVLSAVTASTAATIKPALTTSHAGTTVTRLASLTQDTAAVYTAAGYSNVGQVLIFAPAGATITAQFTAETACAGGAGSWCTVRILIDGVEAEPVVGTDFAFDNGESAVSWESHSVERLRTATFGGSHAVTVQTAVVGATSERLDDWALIANAYAQ